MISGDYKCPYCGEIYTEQGIKAHVLRKHPILHNEFGFIHLNKFPLGHDQHAKQNEELDYLRNFKDVLKIEELKTLEKQKENEKTKDNEKKENVFQEQEEKPNTITKDDLLGVTQTDQPPTETITFFECGNCGGQVSEEMQVCPNCGEKLNWAEVV